MMRVQQLSARTGSFLLEDVSFTVPEGAWGVVIGPAGSGKTTLLETIAGIVPLQRGRVIIGETDVSSMPICQRGVGLVYQHAYLFPHLSVAGNVEYGASEPAEAADLMERLGIASLAARHVSSLSGGERQLVALARSLAQRPKVLLLDEPFSALDPKRRNTTRRLVRDLHRARGITVLQVTHDFAEAGLLGEVSVLLDGGRMLQAGPTAEVFRRPASPYVAEFLGAENVFAGTVSTDSAADASGSTPGSRAVQFQCAGLVIHAVSDMPDGPAHAVIRGEEVVIARTPSVSSARNHFVGLVRELDARGPWARVVVEVDGVPLVAMLTSSAVGDLELETGQLVEVAFKAFAVHLC